MPLKKRASSRPGFEPFRYFKGEASEVERATAREIATPFNEAGYNLPDAESFKAELVKGINELRKSGNNKATLFAHTDKGDIAVQIIKSPGKDGRILIRQHPVTHGITGQIPSSQRPLYANTFQSLLGVLAEGFHKRKSGANVILHEGRREMAASLLDLHSAGIVKGDTYAIELMSGFGENRFDKGGSNFSVGYAPVNQILRINIKLDSYSSKETRKQKIAFYKDALKGWPVHFIKRRV